MNANLTLTLEIPGERKVGGERVTRTRQRLQAQNLDVSRIHDVEKKSNRTGMRARISDTRARDELSHQYNALLR